MRTVNQLIAVNVIHEMSEVFLSSGKSALQLQNREDLLLDVDMIYMLILNGILGQIS
jgi:hypothetical protein